MPKRRGKVKENPPRSRAAAAMVTIAPLAEISLVRIAANRYSSASLHIFGQPHER